PAAPTRRFYLADLVMAVLTCGLVAALFTSGGGERVVVIFVGITVLGTIWALFRASRRAPTCEDCGRRFIPPEPEKPGMLAACPHCGRAQELQAAAIRRWKAISRFMLAALVGFVGLLALALTGQVNTSVGDQLVFMMIAAAGAQLTLLALLAVGAYRRRLERPRSRPCDWCGEVIPLEAAVGPSICPQCRLRHIQPEEARRVTRNKALKGYWFLALLAFLAAFMLWGGGWGGFFGTSPWIGVLVAAVVIFVGIVAALVMLVLVVNLWRRLQFRSERSTLKVARRAAGREGDVIRDGPWTIWYSGPGEPAPELLQQLDAGIRRLEALTGGTPIRVPPTRVLIHEDRDHFLNFHRRILGGLDLVPVDGVQLSHPYHLITLCTAPPPFRTAQPDALLRLLAAYQGVAAAWGPQPPAWLQTGLGRTAANFQPDRHERLNRRMVAALGHRDDWSTELFAATLKGMTRLRRVGKTESNTGKLHQFAYQSHSLVEYLAGERAPVDRRTALGNFLRDPRSKADAEGSFRHHLGLGFGELLDAWRAWVFEQGIGTYTLPPESFRADLEERVLPTIRDPRMRRGNVLLALYDWAGLGYPLGADAAIDRLRDPGDIPKGDLTWALAMVSGHPWGDEPDRWQAWWDDLEDDVAGRTTQQEWVSG
ncbi:MAG: hypothetical protein ACYC61_30560, partial [Isosphaeraceae bacterium]